MGRFDDGVEDLAARCLIQRGRLAGRAEGQQAANSSREDMLDETGDGGFVDSAVVLERRGERNKDAGQRFRPEHSPQPSVDG